MGLAPSPVLAGPPGAYGSTRSVRAAALRPACPDTPNYVIPNFDHHPVRCLRFFARPAVDRTINDLDRFENARTPDRLSRYSPTQPTELRYQMALDELDELVKLIFETSGISAASFVNSIQPDALRYLNEGNQTPLAFVRHFTTCFRASRRCPYHFTAIFNLRR